MPVAERLRLGARDDDGGHAAPLQPGSEERPEILAGGFLECGLQVIPRGDREPPAGPEVADALAKRRFADAVAQHDEQHRRLAVAHRRPGTMRARSKIAQRRLVARRQGQRITQPGQAHLGGGRRGFRFLVGIVGHEGGQPFGPVAARIIDIDAIAPPVVQDLVAERGLADERQAQDSLAKIGQGRHPEPGRQGAGDNGKLAVRVVADFLAVTLDITLRIVKVGLGQPRFRIELGREKGAQDERRRILAGDSLFTHPPGAGHQVDAIGRLAEFEGRAIAFAWPGRQGFRDPPPGHQGALVAGQREVHPVVEHPWRLRIPGAARRQETAFRGAHRRHPLQHATMVALAIKRRQVSRVADLQLPTCPRLADKPLLEAGRAGTLFDRQRLACRRGLGDLQ